MKKVDSDLKTGRKCKFCGYYFKNGVVHEYPVSCPACWERLPNEYKHQHHNTQETVIGE